MYTIILKFLIKTIQPTCFVHYLTLSYINGILQTPHPKWQYKSVEGKKALLKGSGAAA